MKNNTKAVLAVIFSVIATVSAFIKEASIPFLVVLLAMKIVGALSIHVGLVFVIPLCMFLFGCLLQATFVFLAKEVLG